MGEMLYNNKRLSECSKSELIAMVAEMSVAYRELWEDHARLLERTTLGREPFPNHTPSQ